MLLSLTEDSKCQVLVGISEYNAALKLAKKDSEEIHCLFWQNFAEGFPL